MPIEKIRSKEVDTLFQSILKLESVEECYRFFDDLCTVNELHSLAQRLQVAILLEQGATYQRIEEATGASTATISRVKRSLNFGNDGYKIIMQHVADNKEEM